MDAARAARARRSRTESPSTQSVDTGVRPTVRVSAVELSHTVAVQYEVSVHGPDGSGRALVRVQFPDEVRAMLETSTWSHGATILESIASLGTAYLARIVSAGLLSISEEGRAVQTFHLPLADLRTTFPRTVGAGQ
jgi:hypothetical protein